jgi:hypothetical protein
MSMLQAVHAGLAHCQHLGITVDEMAALLEAEQDNDEADDMDGW